MSDQRKKQLAFNIVEFLRTSSQDGTVKEDDKESLEVAISCITEAFGIDIDSSSDKSQYSLAPATLLSLLDVYLKTKAKSTGGSTASPAANSASTTSKPSNSSSTSTGEPSAADKAKADSLKAAGNAQMSQKQYPTAIQSYTQAIALNPDPVYYSNRAAAYGAQGDHEKAAEDAQRAIDLDPSFVKGYSRLGHARFSLGQYKEAVRAYEEGLVQEPSNANMKQSLATARAKLAEEEGGDAGDDSLGGGGGSSVSGSGSGAARGAGAGAGGMPDLSSLAGLMGGLGGGGGAGRGGGGGMPDLASLMNNPQMMAMAQQMMANGGLDRLMANPSVRRMAEQYQAGGGMPDMSQLANDPEMRNLASQFMGGGGGGAGR